MNKIILIGNLTRDPESRTTRDGTPVCSFTIAVNRRRTQDGGGPDADFFRISAWRQLAENCEKYLAKGRKVAVTGRVSASAYIGNDGTPHASMEVQADEVEFLTPKGGQQLPADENGYVQVPDEELPFDGR